MKATARLTSGPFRLDRAVQAHLVASHPAPPAP
jgi:hypothetical protein